MDRTNAMLFVRLTLACYMVAAGLAFTGSANAGIYGSAAQSAAIWLESQQNASDGSWGSTTALQQIQTVSAVRALFGYNRRTPAYYAGLAWIKNEDSGNNDYLSRRALLLAETGGATATDFQALLASQQNAAPYNSGWGITSDYNGSPLDTALALQAIQNGGLSFDATSAITYLKSTQLTGATDQGWPLIQNDGSDAVTTAQIIIALSPYLATDATLATPLTNAAATLAAQVTTSSAPQLQALAAQALLLHDPLSAAGKALLNNLVTLQSSGNWGGDVYATASALQAMAVAEATDLAAQRLRVGMPDENLRRAINQALGRGAMDQLDRGELAKLTSLNIANLGISSLSGLEYAINLTTLNAANNNVSVTTPIKALTALTSVNLNGNPCPGCTPITTVSANPCPACTPTTPVPVQVPVQVPVPDWALFVLAALLLGMVQRYGKNSPSGRMAALGILAAIFHSPGGFAQTPSAAKSNTPDTSPTAFLAPQQARRLQQLSGQILQAYAAREETLKQEADALRSQLQPLQDELAALEDQIKRDIRRRNQDAVSSVKRLTIQSKTDVTPQPAATNPGAQSLAPYKQPFPIDESTGTKVIDIKATVSDDNPAFSEQARDRRNRLLEHIATLRNGQLASTKIIDRKTLESQLDGLRDQLETMQDEPAKMLATVEDLRKTMNPPEPTPFVPAEPTHIAAPDIHFATHSKSSNRKQTRK